MGHSQEDKAISRAKIVAAAARRIRESGIAGFSIADVMKDADLTHGGFYGHFDSRDELVAAALDQALRESKLVYEDDCALSLKQIVTQYLSRAHRDAPTQGCAVVAVGSELSRTEGNARTVMDEHLKRYVQKISQLLGNRADDLAIPIVCMLNGALNLSRMVSDRTLSDKILKDARDHILAMVESETTQMPDQTAMRPTRHSTKRSARASRN